LVHINSQLHSPCLPWNFFWVVFLASSCMFCLPVLHAVLVSFGRLVFVISESVFVTKPLVPLMRGLRELPGSRCPLKIRKNVDDGEPR